MKHIVHLNDIKILENGNYGMFFAVELTNEMLSKLMTQVSQKQTLEVTFV